MLQFGHRSRFESEVHLGLMVIICLLVFLNFVSNIVIYRARSTQREETLVHLRQTALSVSRTVQQAYPEPLSAAEKENIRDQYGLSEFMLVPSRPPTTSDPAKREWFLSVQRKLPIRQLPELAEKLFRADFNQLTRGEDSEYYYLYPIPAGAGNDLLILTVERPDLAYLDDSRNTILLTQLLSLVVVGLIYVFLSRYIFKPFRRLREKAAQAGRQFNEGDDETEAIVNEYEQTIRKLRENEAELIRLNEAIQSNAETVAEVNQYLLESSYSGIITLDSVGVVAAVNDTACNLLGLSSRDYAGRSYVDMFRDAEELKEVVRRAMEDGVTTGYHEYSGLVRSRPESVLGISMSFIRHKRQGKAGLLIFINDLTELTRLRRELEDKNRLVALGEMAAGLAHQMRNALGTIEGYGNLLKRYLKKRELPSDKAEALLKEACEAESLINRFLDFARPFDYTPDRLRLDELLDDVITQARTRFDECDGRINFSHRSAVWVNVDGVLVKQVFDNIIDNAVNAYDSHPAVVDVSMISDGDSVVVNIEDRGRGIPEEDMGRIFTPFFSSRPSGTGLGLPLARKIIDLHGGRIAVESTPGQGSRFSVILPLAQSSGQPSPEKKSAVLA